MTDWGSAVTEADSDATLLAQFQHGNQSAFDQIFLRHYGRVYRAAYSLTQDHAAADDAAQEAFVALYHRPPTATTMLIAWLCRVALNRAANALRGQRREHLRMVRQRPLDPADPSEALILADEHAQVRQAMQRLPERQAQILALRVAGLSYAEIAEAIGVAPSSVGTLLTRAERALLASYADLDAMPHPTA